MTERERLGELHMALDGGVDQLAVAHRLAVGEMGAQTPYADRLEQLLREAVTLRNEVRDRLLNLLGRAG